MLSLTKHFFNIKHKKIFTYLFLYFCGYADMQISTQNPQPDPIVLQIGSISAIFRLDSDKYRRYEDRIRSMNTPNKYFEKVS